MAYATPQQLADRLTGGILKTAIIEAGDDRDRVLAAYLDMASAVIDARLSARYSVPVATTPLLRLICLNLAIWQIAADRAVGMVGDRMPPGIQTPYEQASGWLDKLSSGEMALTGDGASAAEGSGAGLVVKSQPSLFGDLEGF